MARYYNSYVLGWHISFGGMSVGDFFACGWGEYAPVSSLAVCVNPGSAFNYFRKCLLKNMQR